METHSRPLVSLFILASTVCSVLLFSRLHFAIVCYFVSALEGGNIVAICLLVLLSGLSCGVYRLMIYSNARPTIEQPRAVLLRCIAAAICGILCCVVLILSLRALFAASPSSSSGAASGSGSGSGSSASSSPLFFSSNNNNQQNDDEFIERMRKEDAAAAAVLTLYSLARLIPRLALPFVFAPTIGYFISLTFALSIGIVLGFWYPYPRRKIVMPVTAASSPSPSAPQTLSPPRLMTMATTATSAFEVVDHESSPSSSNSRSIITNRFKYRSTTVISTVTPTTTPRSRLRFSTNGVTKRGFYAAMLGSYIACNHSSWLPMGAVLGFFIGLFELVIMSSASSSTSTSTAALLAKHCFLKSSY